jgi:hypothetical protein
MTRRRTQFALWSGQRRLTVPINSSWNPRCEFERNEAAVRVWDTFADYPATNDADEHTHAEAPDAAHFEPPSPRGNAADDDGDVSFDIDSFDTPATRTTNATSAPAAGFTMQTAAELAGHDVWRRCLRPCLVPPRNGGTSSGIRYRQDPRTQRSRR